MIKHYTSRRPRNLRVQEKWSNSYFAKLVSLYRKSPCLWRKDAAHYLDSEQRHRAYNAIHRGMALPGVTFVEIILKIREMRGLYVRELKRMLGAEANDDYCGTALPWFYDLHRFLYPYLDYDEATELHNVEQTIVELEELGEEDFYGDSSKCCVKCLTSNSNTLDSFIDDFLPPARTFGYFNSTSSPVVSMPEVETRPRTCSRSCTKITCPRRKQDKFSSCKVRTTTSGSSSWPIDFKEMSDYRGTAIINKLCKRASTDRVSSSNSSFRNGLDQFEIFSKNIAQYLRRMDENFALKAQAEIQRILMDLVAESNNKKSEAVRFEKISTSECSNQRFVCSPMLKGSCR